MSLIWIRPVDICAYLVAKQRWKSYSKHLSFVIHFNKGTSQKVKLCIASASITLHSVCSLFCGRQWSWLTVQAVVAHDVHRAAIPNFIYAFLPSGKWMSHLWLNFLCSS